MFGLGIPELLIILVIVVLLFGAGKLPQIGSGLGEGIRNFKKTMKEKNEIDVTPTTHENKDKKRKNSLPPRAIHGPKAGDDVPRVDGLLRDRLTVPSQQLGTDPDSAFFRPPLVGDHPLDNEELPGVFALLVIADTVFHLVGAGGGLSRPT